MTSREEGPRGRVRVGISGYDYPGWRGGFYPPEVPRAAWFAYASRAFNSIHPPAAARLRAGRGPRPRPRPPAAARRPRGRPRAGPVPPAFEVRHTSYFDRAFYELLRRHRCAFVIADTAGRFSYAEEVTAGFVYVRLHGSQELYVSGYTDEELDRCGANLQNAHAPAPPRPFPCGSAQAPILLDRASYGLQVPSWSGIMDIDPVCGMTVSRGDVAGSSQYQGKPYYFCSPACKERFDADPARFVIPRRRDDREETT